MVKTYGATHTPHLFVTNRQGLDFVVSCIGTIGDNLEDAKLAKTRYVENAVTEILAGMPATTSESKAIGCSTKGKRA